MPLPFNSRRTLRCLPLLLLAAFTAPAQTPAPTPDQPTTSLQVNARLVVLDVVITGKDGKPVTGLTQSDLQVYEDGKLQRIRSLEPPSAHNLPADTVAAGLAATFDPANPSTFGQSPVNILLLDQLNTHFADSSFARRSVKDYLDKQPALLAQPTTLVSLSDNRFQPIHTFTRDRDALLRSLAAAPTKYAWNLELNGSAEHGPIERLDHSLRSLEEIAQSFARIPGRKTLLWVGGGFPTVNPTLLSGPQAAEVHATLQHITDVLLATRMTLYAVDPASNAAGMAEITDESQQAFADAAGDSLTGAFDPFGATDDFDALGPVTGGRVIRGLNDVAHQLSTSIDLAASFYTLSYSPDSTSDATAKYRTIRVVCLRPGLTATTRTGYYPGQTDADNSTTAATYDLSVAAEGHLPLNGLRVTVASAGTAANTHLVQVAAANLTWKPRTDGTSIASVYILAVALNAKGKALGHTLHGMTATAKAGTDLHDPNRLAEFAFATDRWPSTATLRFIVRDSATGNMGSFDLSTKDR